MASSSGPVGPEARTFCGFCGFGDRQPFTFCPRCGRPAGTLSEQMTMNEQTRPSGLMPRGTGTFGEAPTQAGSYPSGSVGAAAGLINAQTMTGAATRQARRGRRRVSVLTAALLALLVVGSASAYFVYTAFFAYSPTDSARYLPATTLFYSSFDLQQVEQNTHNVSEADLSGATNTSGFEQMTGLDFHTDVAPWIKRSFSFSLVDITQQPAPGGFGTRTIFETVFLISTHDTNASNAAIQKIITNQQRQYGVKFRTITYQSVTLQSDVDSVESQQGNGFGNPANRAVPLVLGIVKDQVIIANTVAVAEQVVDYANGKNGTLAQDSTFTAAMGKLPADRFGTLYINVSQVMNDLLHTGATGVAGVGAANNYPVGYGSLQFTNAGMRLSFTLEAKAGTHVTEHLNGDTNASAGVVPANALLFAGLGNLNGFYHQVKDASNGAVTDESFTRAVGLGPDDPLFNAPVSVALLPPKAGSDQVVEPLVLLHATVDATTASAKVQQAVQNLGYTTTSSTISGTTVTAIHAPSQTVYYTLLGQDLVFAGDSYGISQAIDTFQGRLSSLAGLSTFKELVAQAPKDNALTVFIGLDTLSKATGPLGDFYRNLVKQSGLLAKATAAYLTYSSDDSGITITQDLALK